MRNDRADADDPLPQEMQQEPQIIDTEVAGDLYRTLEYVQHVPVEHGLVPNGQRADDASPRIQPVFVNVQQER